MHNVRQDLQFDPTPFPLAIFLIVLSRLRRDGCRVQTRAGTCDHACQVVSGCPIARIGKLFEFHCLASPKALDGTRILHDQPIGLEGDQRRPNITCFEGNFWEVFIAAIACIDCAICCIQMAFAYPRSTPNVFNLEV